MNKIRKGIPLSRLFFNAVIEIAFILFLFYANLLMGEFTHSGSGIKRGLLWALKDILTWQNFLIGFISGMIGYGFFEYLRSRFKS